MKTLQIPCDPGEVSDGFHTFNELYEHRHALFLALMARNPKLSWLSSQHHDGDQWDGWFIAGMELPTGDVSYHLPNSMMGAAMQTGAKVLLRGKEWDGHDSSEVVTRVLAWASSMNDEKASGERRADHYHSKLMEAKDKGYLPKDFEF